MNWDKIGKNLFVCAQLPSEGLIRLLSVNAIRNN